jgi:hypothetical protein
MKKARSGVLRACVEKPRGARKSLAINPSPVRARLKELMVEARAEVRA